MNLVPSAAKKYAKELADAYKESGADCKFMIACPFVDLPGVVEAVKGTPVIVAAENMANHKEGAYTGEVSPLMLQDLGVNTVILGHSERRQYFGETDETVNKRASFALSKGLIPIICVGETLDERQAGKAFSVVSSQTLKALEGFTAQQVSGIVIAYEPVWAIGTGKTATKEDANEVIAHIRSTVADKFGKDAAEKVRIQYGGSMKPSNAAELMAMSDIDGGLIGGASLKPDDFAVIVKAAE